MNGGLESSFFWVPFELTHPTEIAPWGPGVVSWFELSDGRYDLVLGGQPLLTELGADSWGVGYNVARIWEDQLSWLPSVLEPLPPELRLVLPLNVDWLQRAFEADLELREQALWWHQERYLDSGHLVGAPLISGYRVHDTMRLVWHTPHPSESIRWNSPVGDIFVNVADFKAALVKFDALFMAAMENQVAAQIARGQSSAAELKQLEQQQVFRAGCMAAALTRHRPLARPWSETIQAFQRLKSQVP